MLDPQDEIALTFPKAAEWVRDSNLLAQYEMNFINSLAMTDKEKKTASA